MRLILKIAIDAVRRRIGWSFLLLFAFQLQALPHVAIDIWPAIDRLALTMSMTSFLILGAGALLDDRVLYQLPVSRRQWWQSRWVLGTIGVSLCTVTAVAVASWRRDGHWPSASIPATHLVVTTAFCAVLHTLYAKWWFWSGAEKPATLGGIMALTPLFVVVPATPFLISSYLPHDLAQADWRFSLLLAGVALAAIPGVQHTPPITPRQWIRPKADPYAGTVVFGRTAPSYFDLFTGWRQWLWLETRRQSVIITLVLIALLAMFAAIPDPKHRAIVIDMQRMGFLPFSGAGLSLGSDFLITMTFICLQPFVRPWVANLRAMKCLPASRWLLPVLPGAVGLVGGTILSTALLILHLLVLHTLPTVLPLAMLLEFAALITASETLRMAIPDTLAPPLAINMVGGMALAMGALYLGEEGLALSARAITMLAASILALSPVVVHWSITRNPRLYRRRFTAGLT